jgi:predicted small secreted protein
VPMKRAIVTMVACALLVAACGVSRFPGADVSPAPSATLGDPCAMLTMAQVGSAINFTVNTQTAADAGGTCSWTFADPNNMVAFNTARLTLIDLATFSAMRAATDSGTTITPVASLGVAAFYSIVSGQGTSLSVKESSHAFTVTVSGSAYTTAEAEADELTLAGFVLAGI